jgi:predicted RNA-binding protein YlxR (DUF448 family)
MERRAEPERMCVACRGKASKRTLLRIARTAGGVVVDPTATAPGRGAYVHRSEGCIRVALTKRSLVRALGDGLAPEEEARLMDVVEGDMA